MAQALMNWETIDREQLLTSWPGANLASAQRLAAQTPRPAAARGAPVAVKPGTHSPPQAV